MADHCTEHHALAWCCPETKLWHYLPTCPVPARRWRGPYNGETAVRRLVESEMGGSVHLTITKLKPKVNL